MSGAIFAAAPAAALPSGSTSADADVGVGVGPGAGRNTGAGAWTVVGSGNDLAGAADSFQYIYRTLSNNQAITARVTALENTDDAAKAGLMFRQDGSAGSKFVAIMLNADGGYGIDVRYRTTANTNYTFRSALPNVAAPYWLRLTRTGGSGPTAHPSSSSWAATPTTTGRSTSTT